jgi:hypothetical protein
VFITDSKEKNSAAIMQQVKADQTLIRID